MLLICEAGGAGACAVIPGAVTQASENEDQLDEKHDADGGADRQIFEEASSKHGEVDVEHHDHEQEQHHHRADIDDDEDHGEKLGAEQHEQACGVEEGEDEKQHGVHRVLHGDDHEGRRHAHPGEEIEEQRGERHAGRFAPTIRLVMAGLVPAIHVFASRA